MKRTNHPNCMVFMKRILVVLILVMAAYAAGVHRYRLIQNNDTTLEFYCADGSHPNVWAKLKPHGKVLDDYDSIGPAVLSCNAPIASNRAEQIMQANDRMYQRCFDATTDSEVKAACSHLPGSK